MLHLQGASQELEERENRVTVTICTLVDVGIVMRVPERPTNMSSLALLYQIRVKRDIRRRESCPM